MSSPMQPLAVIARLLDLSERRVQQLSREGVIPKAERGRYDLAGAVRGYVAYLRDLAVNAQSGAPEFGVERARLIKAKADAVEAAWIAVLARLRARLLVLPDRLAPLCVEETTIAGVRDQIRKEVREALDELAAAASSPLILTGPERLANAARTALAILRPPPELTISDWADANRRLSSEASAEPGQ